MTNELEDLSLFSQIKELIDKSKDNIAISVNSEMTILYWNIGNRINEEVKKQSEVKSYGKKIVATLWRQLINEYGVTSFSEKNLRRMMQFADVFTDEANIYSLSKQLTWSHIKELIPINDSLKREFYIEMCKMDKWSVRTLRERINSMLFERTSISKKPEQTIINDLKELKNENKLSPDLVFRDPYFLNFLGLKDTFSEKDLENAILSELQNFILEFGSDFAFLSKQKRITIDDDDFYIDLLFYHRRLKRLIAIELKLGKFKHEYKSQLELYLRWLDKNEKQNGENSPLGILLCTEKNEQMIELLELDKSGIHVATYLTELPPIDWLKSKLSKSIERSKNILFLKKDNDG
ncbi:MAG: PDDEXK nuclease domain-containing protein [Candidatus Sericytochromatia bacterium]